MTKLNNEVITYDEIGNPKTIGSKELTWSKGRQLTKYKDGNTEVNYEYNKEGIRISKEIGNNKTNYYLEGTKIIIEEKNNNVIYYIYDDSGYLIGFKYNNEMYYYQKNYQNDITGIYDSSYNLVVTYKYDGWGNILSVVDNTTNNIGSINPFRYRSYYYDEETSLYYLNSRYYNPKWCRFINADGIIGANQDIMSLNLYAYVSNNPISNTDEDGDSLFKAVKKAVKTATKTALKEIGKVVGRAVVKGTKKYVKNKIDGYYQIGKAYVDSKIDELKIKSKFFYAEVGVSDPTTSLAYSKGTKTIGQYTNKTYKLQNQQISCSTDNILSFGRISGSKSTTDNCFWNNDVEESESINISGTLGHFEFSFEGVFVGVTGGLHYGGPGVDVKAGYYIFRWDWIF